MTGRTAICEAVELPAKTAPDWVHLLPVGAVNGLQIVLGVPREIGSTVLALMIVLIAVQAPLLTRLERWIDRRRANRRHDAAAELTVEKGTA